MRLPTLRWYGKPPNKQRRPLSPCRDVERVGRLGALGLGDLARPEDRPAEHRIGVGPGPAAGEIDRRKGRPGPLETAMRDRDRSDVISISRIGRPAQSRYRCTNEARRLPLWGSTSPPLDVACTSAGPPYSISNRSDRICDVTGLPCASANPVMTSC